MNVPLPARHLGEGELLRLLDRDGAPDELARFDAHAAACARCTAGLESLGRAATIVRTRLHEVDARESDGLRDRAAGRPGAHAVDAVVAGGALGTRPSPLLARTWLRAAVLLLAAMGALVSVRPLRARIRDWVAAVWADVAGRREPHARAPLPPATPTAPARAVLWFVPAGPELRVVFAVRQAAGSLLLAPAAGVTASLEVMPGDAAVTPLASERLLEIRNPRQSRSSYILRLPTSVRRVVVSIANEPARVLSERVVVRGLRIDVATLGRPPS